ncbi:hypothetical protein [Tumebacillus permanentifrigoris]|uniref:Uncharacterized protein n=1 Tax=Tumebacillus permanentifrigoris TaxID=378543 RepID=A0A316D387_9BACL|nr:hypothetical protein [Tumebacillus permanentifrigoris]PWK05300.1 hypothetical protein C7459_12449 [Tumebacillus permanentifrigoris]
MFSKLMKFFKRPRFPRVFRGVQSPSIPKVKTVWMGGANGREVVVQSLTVERYLEIIPALEQIPTLLIKQFEYRTSPVEFLAAAMDLAKEEFIEILEIASGLEYRFIVENVTLAELVRFLKAMYEVNEFDFIAGEIKTLLGGMLERAKSLIETEPPQDQ